MTSLSKDKKEVEEVLDRVLDNLLSTISSQVGRSGAAVRAAVGDVRANWGVYFREGIFAAKFLACFTAVQQAGVSLASMAIVHDGLLAETPTSEITTTIVLSGLVFCLAAESRMVTTITFVSRDDVTKILNKMTEVFDTVRLLAADANDSTPYQKLTALAGAVANYLANTSRPLPRILTFNLLQVYPALMLSQYIYYDASRWDELVQENKTVHPAFVQREIIGLSK